MNPIEPISVLLKGLEELCLVLAILRGVDLAHMGLGAVCWAVLCGVCWAVLCGGVLHGLEGHFGVYQHFFFFVANIVSIGGPSSPDAAL